MAGNHKDLSTTEPTIEGGRCRARFGTQAVLVYATCPSAAEAERIGGALVDQGLAACINILGGMTSIYVWQGSRHTDSEAVMIVKTRGGLGPQVVAAIRALHPYDTPAILELPVTGGNEDFLAWIEAQTMPAAARTVDPEP